MKLLDKFWGNFKSQPDIWFFYGFLATFTLSIRKVLFFYPIQSQFNEYAGIYLYLSDILLILTLFIWIISILYNKCNILSICKTLIVPRLPRRLFHVEQSLRGETILLPFILIVWSFLSITWSANPNIALFRSIKLFEFYLLYLYVAFQIVPRLSRGLFHVEQTLRGGTILRNSAVLLVISGIFNSIIGIWQFIAQHSLGLFWLKESLVAPNMDGVAKIILNGDKIIRGYGLLPHPNILGGLLVITLTLSWFLPELFHLPAGQAGVEHPTGVEQKYKILLKISLLIQLSALIITFSKSAIIGLVIVFIYIFSKQIITSLYSAANLFHPPANVPRGTFFGRAGVEQFSLFRTGTIRRFAIIFLIFIMLLILIKPNLDSFFSTSINQRLFFLNISKNAIFSNPIFGLGMGQFVLNMPAYSISSLELWQFQPVHNVFLLIWSELGLVGLGLFILFLWKLFHPSRNEIVPRGTISFYGAGVEQFSFLRGGTLSVKSNLTVIFRGILLGLIFIMLFDHYLWDIQQGQIMLWLVLGILAGLCNKSIDKL